MPLLIGQTFGRYQILELLGEGGMATVYKAYDTHLEREVAIKVIRRDAFPPDDMNMLLKRFEREAKSLGRLSHPNIVGVIDYGEHDGSPYLVMVYLPGGTLRERLGKPIAWRAAVELILPIAHALEYVHDRNIINRDVKPSNILMTEKGQPMLTDFGLVKLFGEQEKESTHLTSSGTGLGTPDYMAPEQWTGEAIPQSDLYSLGVVLYEMITGRKPFTADTPAGVLLKQATEALPLPRAYIPDLPQEVESVLLKVLAKDPEDRYPNMHTFIGELQNLLAGREVSATSIKADQLRKKMTGRTEATTFDPATGRTQKAFPTLFAVLGGLGALMVIAVIGVLIYAGNGGTTLPFLAAPTQTSQPTAIPSATNTAIPPTETVEVTAAPTETLAPTETAIPSEIRDERNIPMIYIPAGEFTMGSDDSGDVASKPEHEVELEAFYIDKFEVTNEMYDACYYAKECRAPQQLGTATRNTYYANPVFKDYPVIYVDWKWAKAYCEWRGARLPTEAEWEKAARGTDGRLYPWGNEKPDCNFANITGCVGDTTPVDQHELGKSVYGVYGMAGNVMEWTSSLFDYYPYDAADGRENPDSTKERIVRGGAWNLFGGNSGNVRVDTRVKLFPESAVAYVGIRCAKSAQ